MAAKKKPAKKTVSEPKPKKEKALKTIKLKEPDHFLDFLDQLIPDEES